MRSTLSAILLAASLVIISPASTTGAEATTRSVTVTGAAGQAVSTYPAYSPGQGRFGIRSSSAVSQVSVTAASSDPGAVILVDGRPVANGAATGVAGLETGDEINVQITDASGTTSQSWIVTPPGFPAITTTSSGSGPSARHVALTLSSTFGSSDTFETISDTSGVPSVVTAVPYSHSLMAQPNGSYTVARGDTRDLFSSFGIVELDAELRPIQEHRMQSVPTTDFHDAVLLPGGGRILMAYVRNPTTGVLESHLEEVDAAGEVVLTWNSADHILASDSLTKPLGDDAHLNSIEVMQDGNLLLSFRHLSQVMKIDRDTGEVLWRLGGVRSDFDFPDDPLGGPCAQHTARELANGDVQIFDNGAKLTPMTVDKMCPDPADPKGAPRVERGESRVTVYRLDDTTKEATLVDSYPVGGFSQFAGSAQRLGANSLLDNLMVGLFDGQASGTGAQMPDAIELSSAGDPVWSLSAANASSYRALAVPYRDARKPEISVAGLTDGATYGTDDHVEVRYGCTDTGGSNLAACSATVPYGGRPDMRPGTHAVTITARDGAGNTTSRTVGYRVLAPTTTVPASPTAADGAIRKVGGPWKGEGTTRTGRQTVTIRMTGPDRAVAHVRLRNSGDTRGRLALAGSRGNRWSTARWFVGKKDVSARVAAGRYRTRALDAGEAVRLRLVVSVSRTDRLRTRTLRLAASNRGQGKDVVRARIKAR